MIETDETYKVKETGRIIELDNNLKVLFSSKGKMTIQLMSIPSDIYTKRKALKHIIIKERAAKDLARYIAEFFN